MPEFNDRVAPWPRAEDVPDVWDGIAERVSVFGIFEVAAEAAAGPDRLSFKQGLDYGEGFLYGFFEGVDGWTGARVGWRWVVVFEKVG